MALGDTKIMREPPLRSNRGEINFTTDTIQLRFGSNTFASVDENSTTPTLIGTITESSGGNVATFYNLTGVTWSRTGGVSALAANDIGIIDKNALNPTDLRTAFLYDLTADLVIQVWDMTTDGTTPPDLINNDLNTLFPTAIYTATAP